MRLADYLNIEAVDAQLGASNKPGVLRALVGLLLRVSPDLDPNEVVRILEQREALQSTGIGNGIAIPHGRVEGLKHQLLRWDSAQAASILTAWMVSRHICFSLCSCPPMPRVCISRSSREFRD